MTEYKCCMSYIGFGLIAGKNWLKLAWLNYAEPTVYIIDFLGS